MHVYTLVITPGPRRSAVARAERLLDLAAPRYLDHWGVVDTFRDRLGKVERPEIEAWYAAQKQRRQRFERGVPLKGDGDMEYELREIPWSEQEAPYQKELRRLQHKALIDLTRLTSSLPSPLPDTLIPAALVTPNGRWRLSSRGGPSWSRWVNATVDDYRGGHCVVVADCHF